MARRFPPGIAEALGAAAIFGCATPFAKQLGEGVDPQVFAGLLYLGSGGVLAASLLVRPSAGRESSLRRADLPALSGAVVFGGMVAPLLLMIGLRTTPAATASLLLNLEAVFTALGAWLVVREHADRRIVLGMVIIVSGGLLLSVQPGGGLAVTAGALAVVAACLAWGVDNVVTRPLAARDPRQTASVKGIVAGSVNVSIGLALGGSMPGFTRIIGALIIGFLGYGLSLVLYLRAVRSLGTARTGAYYSAAPFFGAGVALVWLREPVGALFVPALVLMGIGLAIHLTEHHGHTHAHPSDVHAHRHVHDAHHVHDVNNVPEVHADQDKKQGAQDEAHAHEHQHAPMAHDHGHSPDQHHRHGHDEHSSAGDVVDGDVVDGDVVDGDVVDGDVVA